MLRTLPVLFALLLFGLISCQSEKQPTLPETDNPDTIGHSVREQQTVEASRNLWGFFRCVADLEEGTISVLPDRSTDFHINATKPLNQTLGLGISIEPGTNPAAGYFIINVSLTHPFTGNPSLVGFDVRGILLGSGSLDSDGLRMSGATDTQLLNADGWSRWWNPSEFTDPGLLGYVEGLFSIHGPSGPPNAMVNPYKAFANVLWPTADVGFLTTIPLNDTGGRAIFSSGSTCVRQYELQFPLNGGPKIFFDYAIDASWAMPTPNPPVQIPGDFPLHANGAEPFLVEAVVTDCTLAGTPYGGAGSGQVDLSIELWDWQGWSNGNYDGQIGDIRLYSPDVDFDPPVVQRTDNLHSSTLTVTATGIPTAVGTVPVLIEIPSPGTAWKQGAPAAPSGEISAYARVSIDVGTMECEADENVICDDAIPLDLQSSIAGAVCQPLDLTDYYNFTVPTGMVLQGTITLDNYDYGDNDLMLNDGCPGDPIDFSMNLYGQTEVINIVNIEAGSYYIAVFPGETAGTDVQPYNLILDIHEYGSECTHDNDNEYTSAMTLGLQTNHIDSVCAGGDLRDWYKVVVPPDKVAGGTIYIDNAGVGNIDVRIYDEYPGPITFWGINPDTLDELVTINGLGPGAHYIEVFALGATPEGDRGFTMDIDLVSADFSCASGDGNDSYLTSDPVDLVDEVSGTTCFPSDPDWYMFLVDEEKAAEGTITLSGGNMVDNDLYLYSDPLSEPIDYSAQPGVADEIIEVSQLDTGTYYIKVTAHPNVGGGDQSFTLTTDMVEVNVGDFDFQIHAHIIRRNDGTNPATTEARVQNDVAWANEFYSQWGGSFTLAEISYINRTSWLSISSNESYQCHLLYRDKTGPINVYYANNFPDMSNAAAYARMDCRPYYQTHKSTHIVMSDSALNRVLAHELGHATGIFLDTYLLDAGFSSCAQIKYYYCPPGTNWSYCDEDDAAYGNMMWFSIAGWYDPEDYWLSDYHWQTPASPMESQVENWINFHTQYPNNF